MSKAGQINPYTTTKYFWWSPCLREKYSEAEYKDHLNRALNLNTDQKHPKFASPNIMW